jgi:hypothetical protein
MMGYWEAMVDPDDPTQIVVTNPTGQAAHEFPLAEAKAIRDALNQLNEFEFIPEKAT